MAAAGAEVGDHPVVQCREGALRGERRRTASGRQFYSFQGVPYAAPPVGSLRFQPPRPHPGWTGERDATAHASVCAQFDFFCQEPVFGSEDCLYANVYTPCLDDSRLPVMVYIHGGGFSAGSGDQAELGPHFFMDWESVVLVTFNYRLGVLGFFSTQDAAAPGNYGLHDMVELLRWVRHNVSRFGGNPDCVTVLGESAGGAAVSLLVLSPLARGLFHRAISQSGSAMSTFAASGRDKGSDRRLAALLNFPADDSAALVQHLRQLPVVQLLEACRRLRCRVAFQPRVDSEAAAPLLPQDPRQLLLSGQLAAVPWMQGVTAEEGTLYLKWCLDPDDRAGSATAVFSGDLARLGRIAELTDQAVTPVFDHAADPNTQLRRIAQFYSSLADPALRLARIMSDRKFVVPLWEESRLASAHTSVYRYVLDWISPDLYKTDHEELPNFGPTHTDDLLYLFSRTDRPAPAAGSPDLTMTRLLVSLWAGFARTGQPHSQVLPMPEWPTFTQQRQSHMRLNLQPSVVERLHQDRVQFWKSLPINECWRHPVEDRRAAGH